MIFLITVLSMSAIFFLHKMRSNDNEWKKTDGLDFRRKHTLSVLSSFCQINALSVYSSSFTVAHLQYLCMANNHSIRRDRSWIHRYFCVNSITVDRTWFLELRKFYLSLAYNMANPVKILKIINPSEENDKFQLPFIT